MQIGIEFDGFDTLGETIDLARRGEEAGAKSVWMAQHMGYREAMMSCMAFASATRRATLIPTAISPWLWPPAPTAMALATLDEAAPGRVGVAVSVGNMLNLAESGIAPEKPVRVIREYVEALRRLWTGEPVTMDGAIFSLKGARLNFKPSAPLLVYVASTGPQVLALSGKIADGVLLSGGLTLVSTQRCLAHAIEGARSVGRDPASVRKAGFIYFSVSQNGADARADLRTKLAFLFRSRPHAENIRSSGLPIDHEAIIAANARRDLAAAAALLPDEAVDAFAVGGTPRQCREQLERYFAAGLEEPVIQISGLPENRLLALEIVREFAR